MYRTCAVGGVQALSPFCLLRVHRMNERCEIDHTRKKRRARGRMDTAEASERVDDTA